MTTPPMMACGHAANATQNGEPVCVICVGIVDGARTVTTAPDLTDRMARCQYGDKTVPSSLRLAFFAHHPDRETDSYYCGCFGWD